MLQSGLCDYSDTYIIVEGTITVADPNDANCNKELAFKNNAPFINCILKINNTLIDNAEYLDIVIPMYNLIEYSKNYSKTTGCLWNYYRDEPNSGTEEDRKRRQVEQDRTSKFATKKWYVIDSQTAKGKYNQNNSIKFEAESIKPCLCDHSDVFIFVTGDITVNIGDDDGNNTYIAFINCALLSTCKIEINDVFIDEANYIYIAMPMYNLIEYSDNYSDTSGSLWQFRRDKVLDNNANLNVNNSQSFKYKAALVGKKRLC